MLGMKFTVTFGHLPVSWFVSINIPVTLSLYLSASVKIFLHQFRYHLLRCIFYHSDDVTCSNETLSIDYLFKAISAGQLCFSPEFDFHLFPSLRRFRRLKLVLWHRRPRRRSKVLLLIEQETPVLSGTHFEWNSLKLTAYVTARILLCHCEDSAPAESLSFNNPPMFIIYPEVSEWQHPHDLIIGYWAKVRAIRSLRAMLKWQLD